MCSSDLRTLPDVQLYDMRQDTGERRNLQADHPEVVGRLTALLGKYIADGRSTPGTPQKNDCAIDIRRAPARAGRAAKKKAP